MKNALFIDFANEKIVMTTTFAKKCYNTASAEYAQLQSVRRDYPTFNVTTRKIKSNPNKENYKGLTYAYMKRYIVTHEEGEEQKAVLKEFEEKLLISECHSKCHRYPVIKKWFLAKYPEVAEVGMPDKEESTNNEEVTNNVEATNNDEASISENNKVVKLPQQSEDDAA